MGDETHMLRDRESMSGHGLCVSLNAEQLMLRCASGAMRQGSRRGSLSRQPRLLRGSAQRISRMRC